MKFYPPYVIFSVRSWELTLPSSYFSKRIKMITHPAREIILMVSFSSCSSNLRSSFTISVALLIFSIKCITSLQLYNIII